MGPSRNASDVWRERAMGVLAGGVSSQFRAPDPDVLVRGEGVRVYDADGRSYLDFALSQGPLIHGHCHPVVFEEVHQALGEGQVWNGLHPREVELAERLCDLIRCAEKVRLGCTGSEMIHAAIRAARARTGKQRILKFEGHYHGWLDGLAFSIHPPLDSDCGPEDDPLAVPWCEGVAACGFDSIVVASWNRTDYLERIFERVGDSIAAVITEPIMLNTGCIWPRDRFLERLRGLCDEYGALLILDEVITGFRVHPQGAQELLGIKPDLAVFGKALGAGFPIAALVGTEESMAPIADGTAIHAGTLNAYVPGVAAALASIRLLTGDGAARYKRLVSLTELLRDRLREASAPFASRVWIESCPGAVYTGVRLQSASSPTAPRNYREFAGTVDRQATLALARALQRRGIRILRRGLWYLSTEHTPADIEAAAAAFRDALAEVVSQD